MLKFLHHLFLPRESNNYRAKLLHHKFLFFFTILFFSAGFFMSYVRTNYPSVLGSYSNISNDQLLVLTNQKRQEAGLSPLNLNGELSQAASGKALDMFTKDYWAHVSPSGTTPWVFIKDAGYNYVYAGENLARGFTTPEDVVNAWMASPTHKENMLSARYSDVGFAVETGKLSGEDTVLVVEMFGSTSFATTKPTTDDTQKETVAKVVPTTSASVNNEAIVEEKPKTLAVVNTQTNKVKTQNQITASQKPLINGVSFSVLSSRVVISLFIFILLLDMIIIERKKILRFVGHNLDHVFFLSLILLIIMVLAGGAVL